MRNVVKVAARVRTERRNRMPQEQNAVTMAMCAFRVTRGSSSTGHLANLVRTAHSNHTRVRRRNRVPRVENVQTGILCLVPAHLGPRRCALHAKSVAQGLVWALRAMHLPTRFVKSVFPATLTIPTQIRVVN